MKFSNLSTTINLAILYALYSVLAAAAPLASIDSYLEVPATHKEHNRHLLHPTDRLVARSSGHLSGGAIAGIVVGGIAFLGILCL